MNIPLKMNRDFEKAMAALNERYGEDFEFLNGFHETQLNFSDFIDGFIDKNVADVTIDANANVAAAKIIALEGQLNMVKVNGTFGSGCLQTVC